ncbi:hypothetical protein PIB30_078250 [Stylosanthes scabra]|uniref:Uncharacterized protein n=1 Tax=Stylosanthes scabra TaxID=79078 RepID=A0ABU6VTF9_9FABA|nr:hypothetical protein [Stylosanthes scabra]
MNGKGWDPSQIGYHSDNSSDGYFSYEDSLLACQIDNDEFQHQARFEAMFETLVQERAEILDNQKRLELKEPAGESPNSDSITSEERNLQRNVEQKEKVPTTEQETTSGHIERIVDPNLNTLPFPSAAKKTWKAKPADPCIVELLKKV